MYDIIILDKNCILSKFVSYAQGDIHRAYSVYIMVMIVYG